MSNDQKIVSFGLALSVALGLVWYFSRSHSATAVTTLNASDAQAPAGNQGQNLYTFNLPPISVPGITTPPVQPIPPPTQASGPSCCRNCGGSGGTSGASATLPDGTIAPPSLQLTAAPQWQDISANTVSFAPLTYQIGPGPTNNSGGTGYAPAGASYNPNANQPISAPQYANTSDYSAPQIGGSFNFYTG